MDAHVQDVIVAVHKFNGFLNGAVIIYFLQSAKLAHPVVHVGHEISELERIELFEGDGLTLLCPVFNIEPLVTVEDLMVGVHKKSGIWVFKAFVQRDGSGLVFRVQLQVFENGFESIDLLGIGTHQYRFNITVVGVNEGLCEEVEILVEGALWEGGAVQLGIGPLCFAVLYSGVIQ